jgi:hypothetical protein
MQPLINAASCLTLSFSSLSTGFTGNSFAMAMKSACSCDQKASETIHVD